MQHKQIQTGVEYAVKTSRGRATLGERDNYRVRIVDTAKAYRTRTEYDDENAPDIIPVVAGEILPFGIERRTRIGMLGVLVENGGRRAAGDQVVVEPVQVAGIWDLHVRVAEEAAKAAAHSKAERERNLARWRDLDARLAAEGVAHKPRTGYEWTFTPDQVEALLAKVARPTASAS